MSKNLPSNEQIAKILEKIAELLEIQDENPFRINAYRDAADSIKSYDNSIAKIALDEGEEKLKSIPNIGEGIASIIVNYVKTGRSEMLERLQGEVSPVDLFKKVPGIGDELAQRISKKLDISTLEELEQAAYDGRLKKIKGFGKKKVKNIQVSLAGMLSTSAQRAQREHKNQEKSKQLPKIKTLLSIDQEYCEKAQAGKLKKIAPKRFNPEGKAWLPILNTHKNGWKITALYSNTAQAHNLNKTHDWVVIYYKKNDIDDQATVVTETKGPLKGKRVVRGREAECREYYQG
jgi:Holliday junction resolvasome RuvABC DNA-binding subunit